MKILFIGGTGNISTPVSRLAVSKGMELFLLNRGISGIEIPGASTIVGDINNPKSFINSIDSQDWDVVVNWIAFTEEDINRDIKIFKGKTKQYIFISSASVYQKPLTYPVVTESTPLANPYWQYSRDKIACEERLNKAYREEGFPITIVRPSHTYDTVIPVLIGGWKEYTVVDRMKKGKKIIVHGDGTSLWTITHAEDFAKGFIGLLGNEQASGHAFHITSDEILTWNQIHEDVAAAAGVKADIIHIASDFIGKFDEHLACSLPGDKAVSVIFDNTKIKTFVPGFNATIPFNKGIKRTLDWFEANPDKKIVNEETNKKIDEIINAYTV
jgi:nucleoside-diphosphate-sugar epimerase